MGESRFGYHGIVLEVNLTSGKVEEKPLASEDIRLFTGGRGLGLKLLWDHLRRPGVDPLSPENPLIFMTGPLSGFPVPSASRTCIVTKSPRTSPVQSPYSHGSTVTYSDVGGFFGPEICFAGYDGLIITGKSPSPVTLIIDRDRIEIKDARKYWGMGTDAFDKAFHGELGDHRFQTCSIGPAGENLVSYASIMHTASRSAGRGGAGCVMGSKNLKAIAIRGANALAAADHKGLLTELEKVCARFRKSAATERWRKYGTAFFLTQSSDQSTMAVKNYREGTFPGIRNISAEAARKEIWVRDYACYCCPLACKKSGVVPKGRFAGLSHEGPEYDTGAMLGANLMISDLAGLLKASYLADDLGLDAISAGNVIGFLMEAVEKGHIDTGFLDDVDLRWENVDGALDFLQKIARRDGAGDLAAMGVRRVSKAVGREAESYAIHVKGLELAGWNVQADMDMAISYATANRGACHLNGGNVSQQNTMAAVDSLGICSFAVMDIVKIEDLVGLLAAITGEPWTLERLFRMGERVYNLEKMFNYREGFRREDDQLPERFFTEPLSYGPRKGAVLDRDKFTRQMDEYYRNRGWDPVTSEPSAAKLEELELAFARKGMG